MGRVLTAAEVESEVKKMSNVMNWPQMHLPVKNVYDEAFERRVGVILHIKPQPYDVFECNQYAMHKLVIKPLNEGREPDCPVHRYNSWQEIVEAGWIGD